jgi:hypothetical protein
MWVQAYLDMVGERADSERRSSGRGAHTRQRLFEDSSGRAVDVYLLDEHFHRSAVPCSALASVCARTENAHTVRCLLHLTYYSCVPTLSVISVEYMYSLQSLEPSCVWPGTEHGMMGRLCSACCVVLC